jgi:sugar phosphate isomerase/epimerase
VNALVATCWTHAGDAAPLRDGERSPLDIRDRIRVAAETGFAGFGVVYADLLVARETIGWQELARQINGAGFTHVEVELIGDWWTEGPVREASDVRRRDLLEAAAVLDARMIKVCGSTTETPPPDRLAREFWALCEEAADVGTRVALEPLPFSNFGTVPDGARFVQEVGHPAGGIIIDVWHVYRAGNTPKDLVDAVSPDHLFGVELNDAFEPTPPVDLLFADTINNRVAPGHGDWDIPGFINVIRQIGFDGPWGVELLSHDQRGRTLEDALQIAYTSGMAVLEAADRRLR